MTLTREAFLNEVAKFQASYPNSWLQSSVPSILTKLSDSVFLLKRVDCNDTLHLDFYIVYSPSYRVPVLFFLPCIAIDNETRFATIDELCDVLLTDDPTSISLAENPVNGLVMFQIHPCRTALVMEEVLANSSHKNSISYLESWLSITPIKNSHLF